MILCGDVMHVDSIKVFLEEFCHPNHRGVDDLRLPAIVLMCPHPPSTELEHFLEVMMGRDRKDTGIILFIFIYILFFQLSTFLLVLLLLFKSLNHIYHHL